MNGEQIQRLLGVYQAYNDVIIPLVFEIELEHKQFPTMILNEIRSFTAHIGRAVGSMNAQDIDNELKKAERHILRIKLDCFKVLCYGYDERFRRVFPKEHRHYDLSIVNNSSFLPEMAKRLNSAKKQTSAAKDKEAQNPDDSITLYQSALDQYRELKDFVENAQEGISVAKNRFWKRNVAIPTITFLIGAAISAFIEWPIQKSLDTYYSPQESDVINPSSDSNKVIEDTLAPKQTSPKK